MTRALRAALLAVLLSLAAAAAASADDPHAGGSGQFGNGGVCHDGAGGNPHCPPHGG